MDEGEINALLNSHGFFKREPEPEPEPEADPDSEEPKEEL